MGSDPLEPPAPGSEPASAADRLRDRVSDARASISQGIREAVDGLEREHRSELQRSTDRIDAMVAERIAEAEDKLDQRMDAGLEQIRIQVEGGLERRVERLLEQKTAALWKASEDTTKRLIAEAETNFRAEIEQRSRGALAAIDEAQGKVTDRLENAAEKLSRKARRHDRRVARRQANRRIEAALTVLETRAEESQAELAAATETHRRALDEKVAGAAQAFGWRETKATEAGREIEVALARLTQGVERAESTLAEVVRSERQMAEAANRVISVEKRLSDAVDTAGRAQEAELRIRRAADQEFEVAKRIEAAEERLAATIDATRGARPVSEPESKAA